MYVICFFVVGHERIIPFKMVIQSRFQVNFQLREVPMVETLPQPVSTNCVVAHTSPTAAVTQGYGPQADQKLVDALVEGVSHEDAPTPDLEDEPLKEVEAEGSRLATKR